MIISLPENFSVARDKVHGNRDLPFAGVEVDASDIPDLDSRSGFKTDSSFFASSSRVGCSILPQPTGPQLSMPRGRGPALPGSRPPLEASRYLFRIRKRQ